MSPDRPQSTAGALRRKWDERHGASEGLPEPALVLSEFAHLLPKAGRALDLACGLGANALMLAGLGLETTAWDLSPVAIARLSSAAREWHLPIQAEVRDLLSEPPPPVAFDVIVVAHFLDRGLAPAISAALRPDGLLYYQTWVRESVGERGPTDPAYRLDPGELLRLFPDLRPIVYRDEGRLGNTTRGLRDLALLVAQRRSA